MEKRLIDNIYFRDLMMRQNRSITEAQLHLYENAKRYCNEEIRECFQSMKEEKQIDLDGKPTNRTRDLKYTDIEERMEYLKDEISSKEEELKDIKDLNFNNIVNGAALEKKLEEKFIEKLFIYNRKIVMIDDKHILKITYKSLLFEELIYEFTKLYAWLDSRAAYLKFIDDSEKEHVIDKTEIATVIHFFEKLNKIKRD